VNLTGKDNSSSARESTGIPRLDEVIGGGFPRPSIVAIIGAPGCGTTSFCKRFVVSSLLRGRRVMMIPADEPDQHYLRHFESIQSFDIRSHIQSKKLVVFDLYEKFTEYLGIRDYTDLEFVKDAPLATITMAGQEFVMNEIGQEPRKFNIVIDSLTALSPFIGLRGIHVAIHEAQNIVRARNHIIIMTAHDGVLEGNIVQALRQYADSVIRMRMRWVRSELKREMIIEKVSFTEIRQPVLEFKITNLGIEIL